MARRMMTTLLALSVLAAGGGCRARTDATASPAATDAEDNPLLAEWTGPYGGVPAFDRMQLVDLEAAVRRAIQLHLIELDVIAQQPVPPTFENTIVAMERAGQEVDRVGVFYGLWRANLSNEEFRELDQRLAPMWSEYETKIVQNEALFDRVRRVYASEEIARRAPMIQRMVKVVYDRFARQGAALSADDKQRYAEIERRLAELYTTFGNNVLADEESDSLVLEASQLAGLPPSVRQAAASAAEAMGQPGKYAITNTRSSMEPFLTYADDRALREKVWRNYYSRGDHDDEHDNKLVITEILELRDERVKLLGYPNFATWRLENRMAKTPEAAMSLMEQVWKAAIGRVEKEVADMQAIADRDGAEIEIEPWDYRYYANRVRLDKYALDADEVKQYLQLDRLRDSMFMVAKRLFGFVFTRLPPGEVPVFHEDVEVWKVTDELSGKLVGLWYLDPFARPGKRSGAWATTYRSYSSFDGERTVLASNNANFVKGSPGEPVLVSWDDATTLFHEFGHALHFLSSNAVYPALDAGVRDYTEFQSQLLERWLLTDEVIGGFLVHHETGEPMPAKLVAKIRKASTFNQGFETTEYLASAWMDMKFHTVDPTRLDTGEFERQQLDALGMPSEIVMRHRSPHFLHVFSGEGYAAGYYGYLWADVLTADAAEAFAAAPGGFYDAALADKLVKYLFAPRNSLDPAEAYRSFRGRDATIDALMRDRGFADE